jgi:hypothetical protein
MTDDNAVKNQLKQNPQRGCLRGCRHGCFGCFTFLLIAAVPFWWFCLHTTPLRISKETTYVTSPLTQDGKRIDYFRAFEERCYPPEMKTDDNGYRIIVRNFGDLAKRDKYVRDPKTGEIKNEELDPEPFRLQLYEKLGLDPNIKPTLKIESPDTFLLRLSKNNNADNNVAEDIIVHDESLKYTTHHGFWTFKDFPRLPSFEIKKGIFRTRI